MEEFLKSVERRAFRMAEMATGSVEDALDLVQDAMLRMVEKYATKPPEQWKPLFYRIVQNRIRDWYRRNTVRSRWRVRPTGRRGSDPENQEDPMALIADPIETSPARRTLLGEARRALDLALKKLPHRQQQAFLMRAWEGLSVAETAMVMKCTQGSVKTHYSRAVHTLRKQLEGHWP
jgi:RNA polymerase sigma-70 factor (ECF subfamily)